MTSHYPSLRSAGLTRWRVMTAPIFGSPTTALCRILAYAGLTLALMPVQLLAVAWQWPLRKRLPFWYHRRTCRLLGIEIERHGQPSGRHPTLYVANQDRKSTRLNSSH